MCSGAQGAMSKLGGIIQYVGDGGMARAGERLPRQAKIAFLAVTTDLVNTRVSVGVNLHAMAIFNLQYIYSIRGGNYEEMPILR